MRTYTQIYMNEKASINLDRLDQCHSNGAHESGITEKEQEVQRTSSFNDKAERQYVSKFHPANHSTVENCEGAICQLRR